MVAFLSARPNCLRRSDTRHFVLPRSKASVALLCCLRNLNIVGGVTLSMPAISSMTHPMLARFSITVSVETSGSSLAGRPFFLASMTAGGSLGGGGLRASF